MDRSLYFLLFVMCECLSQVDNARKCQHTMQSIQLKQLRRKRDTYRRSKTVAALPASLPHQCSITQQQQPQSTELASSSSASHSQPVLFRSSSRTSRSSVSSASVDLQHTPSTTSRTAPHKRLVGRTPSSPSMLLSRMRELIREKVVETTVNRSDLAAVERERRQRAADAFVESLRRHQQRQQQQLLHRHSSDSAAVTAGLALSSSLVSRSSARRNRTRSDPLSTWLRRCSPGSETLAGERPLPTVGSSSKDVAKKSFRENRSRSDDTNSHRHRTTAPIGTTRRLSHDVSTGQRSKGYTVYT